jgi:hypothetical protein
MQKKIKEENAPSAKILKLRDQGKIQPGSYFQKFLTAALQNQEFWKDSPFKGNSRLQ